MMIDCRGAQRTLSRGLRGSNCLVPLAVKDVLLDVHALESVDVFGPNLVLSKHRA